MVSLGEQQGTDTGGNNRSQPSETVVLYVMITYSSRHQLVVDVRGFCSKYVSIRQCLASRIKFQLNLCLEPQAEGIVHWTTTCMEGLQGVSLSFESCSTNFRKNYAKHNCQCQESL
eukprot:GHVL01000966.1.p1 GENE.GHVL01000966.1~~GHVL01000966.1.p1  ORF type:complete len:116 (-),score=6.62 GHVL01000966.1:254-601(-)